MMTALQASRFRSEYQEARYQLMTRFDPYICEENGKLSVRDEGQGAICPHVRMCIHILNLLAEEEGQPGRNTDTNNKFKLLNLARRAEILHYDLQSCNLAIQQLIRESVKLDVPWRRNAITDMLHPYRDGVKAEALPAARQALAEARAIRDTHFDNVYFKMSLTRRIIRILNYTLLVAMLGVLAAAGVYEYQGVRFQLGTFQDLLIVALFGLLGAAFSTYNSIKSESRLQASVIKQMDAGNLTMARLAIGACAGLLAFLVLNAGWLSSPAAVNVQAGMGGNSGQVIVPNLSLAMLPVIFGAGFTERMILNFIERMLQEKGEREKERAEIKGK